MKNQVERDEPKESDTDEILRGSVADESVTDSILLSQTQTSEELTAFFPTSNQEAQETGEG